MQSDLSSNFLRKVWKRLRDSPVPVVDEDDYKNAELVASELNVAMRDHLYLPSTIHGYLGIQKGGGVTRFLPILTAKDMGVYYYLCYMLAPKILVKKKGVFGGWHVSPEVQPSQENDAEAFSLGYGGVDPFSNYWWLVEWRQFNNLIGEVISDGKVGKFVVSTDVANFYDSIEVPRLISRLRRNPSVEHDAADALNAFLSFWNRKHTGYMPSTKGIPQEIISDASRILSHFYLQEFDDEFSAYCDVRNLTYIRWADDILVFGNSKGKLQSAVHQISRILRDIGLNLNASKTKYMSKSQLKEHRCLDVIDAISADDHKKVVTGLAKIKALSASGADIRLDTVFKAMIGYLSRNKNLQTTKNKAFVLETAESHPDLLHSLNKLQMLRFLELADNPMESFKALRKEICKADFGGPKASFLHMMRKYRNALAQMGMTQSIALSAIADIEKSSADSDVIIGFCVPLVRAKYLGKL